MPSSPSAHGWWLAAQALVGRAAFRMISSCGVWGRGRLKLAGRGDTFRGMELLTTATLKTTRLMRSKSGPPVRLCEVHMRTEAPAAPNGP